MQIGRRLVQTFIGGPEPRRRQPRGGKQLEIIPTQTLAMESMGLDQMEAFVEGRFLRPRQAAKIGQSGGTPREIAAGEFPDHQRMGEHILSFQRSGQGRERETEMVNPNRCIHQDHQADFRVLFWRGATFSPGMAPPSEARRRDASRWIKASSPKRTTAVFAVTPVCRMASAIRRSSKMRVVFIHIKVPYGYGLVNVPSGLGQGLRGSPGKPSPRRMAVLLPVFPRLALAPPAHYFNRVRERLTKLPWVEIGILLAAAVLRTVLLDIKPPHFDEGINGWFADQMRVNGFYHYDPTNYHGPLHFYAVFLSQTLFGRNLWALRLPAIIPALLAVWALLRYREFFGTAAARWAAAAMAVSPAFVFYGRYSIHESWMVLFSILLLWAVLGLWEKGERRFLFTGILALTGMILTKETYVVHAGCLILAGLVLWLWQKVLPSRPAFPIARQLWSGRDLGNALALGLLALVFFYSGNFLDWAGLKGLYETYAAWFHTGVQAGGHEKNTFRIWEKDWLNSYWVALMARYEWPALAGLLACARYIVPSDARLRYVAISAGGVLVAYSIIPYKTPWCIISILWPFYLILGAIVQEIGGTRVDSPGARISADAPVLASVAFKGHKVLRPSTLVAFLLLAVSLGMALRLNFFQFTNEKEPYVYVQTYPEIETLTKPLLEMAAKDPRAYHLRGQSVLESYYPLPWILGDFTDIGYFNTKAPPAVFDGDFVLAEKGEAAEVEPKLIGPYYKRTFRLRDAQEECVVYFREKPFRDWFQGAAPEITNPPPP